MNAFAATLSFLLVISLPVLMWVQPKAGTTLGRFVIGLRILFTVIWLTGIVCCVWLDWPHIPNEILFVILLALASLGLMWLRWPVQKWATILLILFRCLATFGWGKTLWEMAIIMMLGYALSQTSDSIEGQEISPDHTYTAGVVLREGSAVVRNVILVVIHDGSGQVDPVDDPVLFKIEQVEAPRVRVEWKGTHALTVHYGRGSIYNQLNFYKGVAITYEKD